MKKFLLLAVLLGILTTLGIASGIDQAANGTISSNLSLALSPSSLNFGQITAGNSKDITSTFTGSTSNLQISQITLTPTFGSIFTSSNVKFSKNNGSTFDTPTNAVPISIPAQSAVNVVVRLTVPSGTTSGSFQGTITYTVLEA